MTWHLIRAIILTMKDNMVRKTVRIPVDIHDRLKHLHLKSPHISLNAFIVEALQKGLAK